MSSVSRFAGWAAALLILSLPPAGRTQDASGQVVVARANSPNLPAETVRFVAGAFKPTILTGVNLEGAQSKKTFEIIEMLCGSVNPTYYQELTKINGGRVFAADEQLGEGLKDVQWPACLRVAPLAATADAEEGESSDPFKALVGQSRTRTVNTTNPLLALVQGRLSVFRANGFVAAPVELTPNSGTSVDAAQTFPDAISAVSAPALRGHIVDLPDDRKIDPESDLAKVCRPGTSAFNAALAASAYGWSLKRRASQGAAPGVAAIYVIDNGFFGADPTKADPFPKTFPGALFPWAGKPSLVGPTTPFGTGEIAPINYLNGFDLGATPSADAAHGTHVAGLTIGGPQLKDFVWTELLTKGDQPRMQLTIINLGKGERDLLPNSQKQIRNLLAEQPVGYTAPKSRIVNMSLAYDGDQAAGILSGLFIEATDTLFVVSAGNDGVPVTLARVYPGALGNLPNVISVAAHDTATPSALAWFTNYGPSAVDIAAPGCGVQSWFDASYEAPLSGTSQAAPLVSFAAGLLVALDGSLTPRQIRHRILASGDLLDGGERRWNIVSGSKLDIAQALLLYDDLVKVRRPDPADLTKEIQETWIGDIVSEWALRCVGLPARFQTGMDADTVWAFKRQGADAVLFYDRNAVKSTRCAVEEGPPAAGAATPSVTFVRRARISGDAVVDDAGPVDGDILQLSKIDLLVPRGPSAKYP